MDLQLQCPFTMLVCGASGSGKTQFTKKLIQEEQMFASKPKRVVWCYGIWQPSFTETSVEYHEGLPTHEILEQGNMVLVIDDLMQEAKSSHIVSDIFTKHSHHRSITCICLIQNLFPKGSEMRNISLNADYLVLMKNPRDRAQIRHLAVQMYPGNTKFLLSSYEDATKQPYSYIFLDCRNNTLENMRVRGNIFLGNEMNVYVPTNTI